MFVMVPLKKFWLRHYHYDVFQPYEITKHGIDSTITGTLLFNFRTTTVASWRVFGKHGRRNQAH